MLVGLLGGALNAAGGGATFLVFPALVLSGVSPLVANVTATVGLWPASIATSVVYRRNLEPARGHVGPLAGASAVGGAAGAALLLSTPVAAFTRLVPFLLLAATLVFTFGEPLARWLSPPGEGTRKRTLVWVVIIQALISVYGGYFGAGMGILMLAQLTLFRIGDMHVVNALRSVLVMVVNAVCVGIFVCASAVAWRPGLVVMGGAIVGGYSGAIGIRRVPARYVRALVMVVAWAMTVYFLLPARR